MLINSPTARCSSQRIKFSNLFVVSGPSGVGKSSALNGLLAKHPDQLVFPLTYSTRIKRAGEVHGRDMNFVSRAEWCSRLSDYLAHTSYQGNFYGTLRSDIEAPIRAGKKVVLAMDFLGVECLRSAGLNPVVILMVPGGPNDLRRWLSIRWPEGGPELEARLASANRDLGQDWQPDYTVVSETVPQLVSDMEHILCLT